MKNVCTVVRKNRNYISENLNVYIYTFFQSDTMILRELYSDITARFREHCLLHVVIISFESLTWLRMIGCRASILSVIPQLVKLIWCGNLLNELLRWP